MKIELISDVKAENKDWKTCFETPCRDVKFASAVADMRQERYGYGLSKLFEDCDGNFTANDGYEFSALVPRQLGALRGDFRR